MIRTGTLADLARSIELLGDSHRAAGFDRDDGPSGFVVPFDPRFAERLFLAHLQAMNACCLVLDVEGCAQGLLLALAYEHPFGPVMMSRETVWWIDPAHRGRAAVRMLDAYEAWSQGKRCAFAGMAGMGGDPVVANLYRRRGYVRAETHFLKAI